MKVAITGGGSGIGAALARGLAEDGHEVWICGRRSERLEEVAQASDRIRWSTCDVSNEEQVGQWISDMGSHWGELDLLINAAGLFGAIGPMDQTDSEQWWGGLKINLFGTYAVTKAAMGLIKKGQGKRILNFAGGGAFSNFPNYSCYAVSKAGTVRLSENLSEELLSEGISVNCLAPGFVATEIHEATLAVGGNSAGSGHFEKTKAVMHEGKGASAQRTVDCVRALLRPEYKALTGKTLSVNFDPWERAEFIEAIPRINASDLYTSRRVNLVNLTEDDRELRDYLTLS